MTATALDSAGR